MVFSREEIDKLLNYVEAQENKYLETAIADMQNDSTDEMMSHMGQGVGFQKVRHFIQEMIKKKEGEPILGGIISPDVFKFKPFEIKQYIPYDPCVNCPNRPMNGEIKACLCILPHRNQIT